MPRAKAHEGRYLSFTAMDNRLLDAVAHRSGYNATALVRRFLVLYGSGARIAGLPVIEHIAEADHARETAGR